MNWNKRILGEQEKKRKKISLNMLIAISHNTLNDGPQISDNIYIYIVPVY
jgi:hypothetical protein